MMDRWIEEGLTDVLDEEGAGAIVFSPLRQGILTGKYLNGIPENSRASRGEQIYLNESDVNDEIIGKVRALNDIAQNRGQSLAQLALAWVLNNKTVTSAIIGASRVEQINDSVAALDKLTFSAEELAAIDAIVQGQ